MNLEVGMYVRSFDNGYHLWSHIYKIKDVAHLNIIRYHKIKFKIASHNIIDLIEVGDYVNGLKITKIENDPFIKGQINLFTQEVTVDNFGDRSITIFRGNSKHENIKSVVTKERFKSMEYEVQQ